MVNTSSYKLCDGPLSLGLAPEIGGRIMSLCFRGEEFLFSGPDSPGVVVPQDIPDLVAFKRTAGFRVFGGDKTWIAPEAAWMARIPPLDLDAAPYRVESLDRGVRLISPVCRETGLQVERDVSLAGHHQVLLRERITNCSAETVTRGIWNVTQVRRPFTVWFPGCREDFRSYHLADPSLPERAVALVEREGLTGIPCTGADLFKFGGSMARGYSLLVKPVAAGELFWERVFAVDAAKAYAHRSMVEVFNSDRFAYGEVEVHSPLAVLAPGESATLEQTWLFR